MCWEGWEEGHSHSLVTRSQSSAHRWARMAGGAAGGPFPSLGQLVLINPQQVRLCLTRFPEGSVVERAECLGCFTMVPFPPPARSTWGFFSNIPCENQVTLLEVNLRKGSPMTAPPPEALALHQ